MNKKNRLKILVGVLCVVLVLLLTVAALLHNRRSEDPGSDPVQTEPTANTKEPQLSTGSTDEPTQEAVATDPTESTDKPTQETVATDPTEKPQRPTEGANKPTQGTVATNPTEDAEKPTQGTVATDPTEDAEKPTQGTVATDPTEDAEEPTQETNPTEPTEESPAPPEVLPPSVVIPPDKDPETGEEIGVSFPCQIPGYDMTVEKMEPYNGIFVEDGSNANISNVAMLLVTNNGDVPVEYTQIRVVCGQEEFLFDISALPAGEKLVVQEKTGKTISENDVTSVSALVVQRANMEMSENKVQVTDNGNNTLTVKNLTNNTIPTIRIFYKYYMEDEKLFVGGIAFTVRISRLGAGASVTIQPSHYTSQTSRVVMVLTYDSEV